MLTFHQSTMNSFLWVQAIPFSGLAFREILILTLRKDSPSPIFTDGLLMAFFRTGKKPVNNPMLLREISGLETSMTTELLMPMIERIWDIICRILPMALI